MKLAYYMIYVYLNMKIKMKLAYYMIYVYLNMKIKMKLAYYMIYVYLNMKIKMKLKWCFFCLISTHVSIKLLTSGPRGPETLSDVLRGQGSHRTFACHIRLCRICLFLSKKKKQPSKPGEYDSCSLICVQSLLRVQ